MSQSQETLMQVFNFSESDLATNQNGEMSPPQQDAVHEIASGDVANSLILGIFTVVVALVAYFIASREDSSAVLIAFFSIASAALFIIFLNIANRALLGNEDRNRMKVSAIEGEAKLDSVAMPMKSYFMTIEDERLPLTAEQANTVKTGDSYRVYYAPYSKTILSITPSEDD